MAEAIEKTKLARDFSAGVPLSGAVNTEHKDLHHYTDGDRLLKRAMFARSRVRKHFGKRFG